MLSPAEHALFEWVRALHPSLSSPEDLWDGRVLLSLLAKVSNFPAETVELTDEDDWKVVLANLKKIVKAVGVYYTRHLRSKFDADCADLLLVAQYKDATEIMKLVLQVFGLCIQGPNGAQFIQVIVHNLSAEEKQQLMECIRVNGFGPEAHPPAQASEQAHSSTSINKKSEVEQLLCKVDEQEQEIKQLQKAVDEHKQLNRQLNIKLKNAQEENLRLKDEVDTALNAEQLLMPEKMEMEKAEIDTENAALVEELKKKLEKQTEEYRRELQDMKETVEFLQGKLERKTTQCTETEALLKEASVRTGNTNILLDHGPCITMVRHHELLNAKSQKITELQREGLEMSEKMAKLKAENQDLNRKNNKLQQEAANRSDLITRGDYDKLKVNVLTMLLDKFKKEAHRLKTEAQPAN